MPRKKIEKPVEVVTNFGQKRTYEPDWKKHTEPKPLKGFRKK